MASTISWFAKTYTKELSSMEPRHLSRFPFTHYPLGLS